MNHSFTAFKVNVVKLIHWIDGAGANEINPFQFNSEIEMKLDDWVADWKQPNVSETATMHELN